MFRDAPVDRDGPCYRFGGVHATWADADGNVRWEGWLPHLDLQVSRELTQRSAQHEQLWNLIERPGKLTLRTRLNLENMLRPAVQVGSQRGYDYATEEQVSLTFHGSPSATMEQQTVSETPHRRSIKATVPTGSDARFTVAFHTNEDDRKRPLALNRFLLPWSPTGEKQPEKTPADRTPPELEGGDWLAGRRLFFGERAMCSRCHSVNGQGGQIGPDLSNLVHRDYASVRRDIAQPSAALNPDHIAYEVRLEDGRTLVGVPRSVSDKRLLIGDAAGNETPVGREEVASMEPLPVSIMPPNLHTALGEDGFRDLMTFLMTRPLDPAPIEQKTPPSPRSRAEVEAVLSAADAPAPGSLQPMRILLIDGPKDHGPDEHDYPLWKKRWSKLLALAPRVEVETASGLPSADALEKVDVVVIYRRGVWNDEHAQKIDDYLAQGGGLVYIHWAVDSRGRGSEKAQRIGLAWGQGAKFRHGPLDLSFRKHPITRGFDSLELVDESYWNLQGDPSAIHRLATGVEESEPRPLMWTRRSGEGRVFVSIPGHYTWTFDDPLFRILLLRGIAWSGRQPVDRLTDLATIGARMSE